MNARQVAKLNMYRTVQQLCDANSSITKTNAAFTAANSAFANKILAIVNTAGAMGQVTTGITIDKNVDKETLAQAAAYMAGLVFAYASKTNNNTLKQAVNFSYSDIFKQKGDLPLAIANNIYTAASNNLAALADSGVTAASLADLKAVIDAYNNSVHAPGTSKSEKGTHTDNMVQLIKDADSILKDQMDKLVIGFKKDYPDFVSSYFNARVIIDPGTATTKPVEVK